MTLPINDYEFKFHKDFYTPIASLIKTSTIRLDQKPVKEQDKCYIRFVDSDYPRILVRITKTYQMKFKDLTYAQATYEGYRHVDLLKHEIRTIYPEITDDTMVYVYHFSTIEEEKKYKK